MSIYRTAYETCAECGRPLTVLSCNETGTPGVFCSPACIDEAKKRATLTKGSAR